MAEKKTATADVAEPTIDDAPKPPEATEHDNEKDGGAAQVQAKARIEREQGFRGAKVDPTPDEAYTLKGVGAGMPTPETDPNAYADAQAKIRNLSGDKFPDAK